MIHDKSELPVILRFHGGGFCISQADWFMYYRTCCKLAKSVSAICISVFLLAACDDGYKALLWIRSLAQGEVPHEPWLNEHADFARVFLVGDSHGGNLVHEVVHVQGRTEQVGVGTIGITVSDTGHGGQVLSLALPVNCTKDHPSTYPMGPAAPPLAGLNLTTFLLCVAENDLIKDTEIEY